MSLSRFDDSSRALAATLCLGLGLTLVPKVLPAQEQPTLDTLRQRQEELDAVRQEQKQATEIQDKLKAGIDAIGEDRKKLNQALIDSAARLPFGPFVPVMGFAIGFYDGIFGPGTGSFFTIGFKIRLKFEIAHDIGRIPIIANRGDAPLLPGN